MSGLEKPPEPPGGNDLSRLPSRVLSLLGFETRYTATQAFPTSNSRCMEYA